MFGMSEFLLRYALLWSLYQIDRCGGESAKDVYTKECQGSSTGLSHSADSDSSRYGDYKTMYTNCTLVTLNLEIVFLQLTGDQYDLSFLENIREVNGYVLIYGNHLTKIRLNRLRVIRGFLLYMKNETQTGYSLYVSGNAKNTSDTIGLRELQMTSLVEILHGDLLFRNNKQLCLGENSIKWEYILNGREANLAFNQNTMTGYEKIDCKNNSTCHENCPADANGNRFCWGQGPDMCQSIHTCGDCEEKRCFQDREKSCCDRQCIAGCSEDKSRCLSCRNYARNKGDKCVEDCSAQILDSTNKYITPDDKYMQGSKCVKKCDNNMVLQDGRCTLNCMKGFMRNTSSPLRECTPCIGDCPTTCGGTDGQWLHRNNLPGFLNCITVNGDLSILNNSFRGHPIGGAIAPEELEQLSTIEEITGTLKVEASYSGFTSLNFLRNLRVIGGAGKSADKGLVVTGSSLTTLELNSLEAVKEGMILISNNLQLCFVEGVNWTRVEQKQPPNIGKNKNSSLCDNEGFVCSSSCLSSNGCMGPSNASCISCPHFQAMDLSCLPNCPTENGFYVKDGIRGNKQCRPCHKECKGNCSGDGAEHCFQCKHVQHVGVCIAECPPQTYPDVSSRCQPCNSVCNQCTGNNTLLGQSGCKDCGNSTIRFDDDPIGHCITSENECNETYFKKEDPVEFYTGKEGERRLMRTCQRCHPECIGCIKGPQPSNCKLCRNYRQVIPNAPPECVFNCSTGFYDAGDSTCQPCDSLCSACFGPSTRECDVCKHVRIDPKTLFEKTGEDFGNGTDQRSFCAEECPAGLNQKKSNSSSESNCIVQSSLMKIVIPIFVVLFLIIIVVVVILFVFWRKQKLRRLRENILAIDEIQMINSGKARPDMSLLRLIKESELRRGNIIGSGAFGTVYKGMWIPEKENVKIPVAIKVLKESSNTNLNVELLDESRIMASVCNPYCVRILAVCMTAQMMLITQLMPLGCLLDYVRKERSNIGSRALLLWSVQIAKGMKYLEELGIVHRDLAARNVLVHNPNQVKITDFGLAKLLNYEEEEIHSEGGKMPIKWLALECIQHRVYTHKSDVWSYGVTLWEMFTYGDRPYEKLQARQVPHALEKGERLSQPSICTIDIYTILIKCWMLDFESRPSFSDLVNEFTQMASDPGRYLVIPGDALMRLPSRAPDASELIRMFSLPMDESGLQLMTGDEYLRPMDLGDEGSGGLSPQNSSSYGPLMSIQEDVTYENSEPTERREHGKEAGLNESLIGKLSHQESREPDQRYIAEPCRNGSKPTDTCPKFQVDEDGYLPPQSVADQPNYLDLDGSPPPQNQQQYLDMRTNNEGISRDNLEYFDDDTARLTDDQ